MARRAVLAVESPAAQVKRSTDATSPAAAMPTVPQHVSDIGAALAAVTTSVVECQVDATAHCSALAQWTAKGGWPADVQLAGHCTGTLKVLQPESRSAATAIQAAAAAADAGDVHVRVAWKEAGDEWLVLM